MQQQQQISPPAVHHLVEWTRQLLPLVFPQSICAQVESIVLWKLLWPFYESLMHRISDQDFGSWWLLEDRVLPLGRFDIRFETFGSIENSHFESVDDNDLVGRFVLSGIKKNDRDKLHDMMSLLVFILSNLIREDALLSDHHAHLPTTQRWYSREEESVHRAKSLKKQRPELSAPVKSLQSLFSSVIPSKPQETSWQNALNQYEMDRTEIEQYSLHFGVRSLQSNNPDQDINPRNRFTRLLSTMEHLLISPSPHVSYSTPHLLRRLREFDLAANEVQDRTDSLDSNVHDEDETLQERVTRLVKTQYPSHQSILLTQASDRTALQSFKSNNDSIKGLWEHQAILLLQSFTRAPPQVSEKPCWSRVKQLRFYDSSTDQPLGQFLANMVKQVNERCQASCDLENRSSICDEPASRHIWSMAHGKTCVDIHVETLRQAVKNQPWSAPDVVKNGCENRIFEKANNSKSAPILLWSVCGKCRNCSSVKPMSNLSWGYSFGKYMELLIANRLFTCHTDSLCKRSSNADNIESGVSPRHLKSIRQMFLVDGIYLVVFSVRPLQLFDVSLPTTACTFDEDCLDAGDGYGVSLNSNANVLTLKKFIDDYWSQVYDTIKSWESSAFKSPAGSSLLVLLSTLMRERLCSVGKSCKSYMQDILAGSPSTYGFLHFSA